MFDQDRPRRVQRFRLDAGGRDDHRLEAARRSFYDRGFLWCVTEGDLVTFTSTGIEVTGENTANITGDLTMNGVTKSVVLDATLNQVGEHPMANKPWAGFDATTTLVRSDFDLGQFAPFVSDEVEISTSIERRSAKG